MGALCLLLLAERVPGDGRTLRTASLTGLCVRSHPSPAEHVEVLQELQRLQRRLQPFLQRYCEVLGAAATTDYNNNVSPSVPPFLVPQSRRLRHT
jgi:hypothetical protein